MNRRLQSPEQLPAVRTDDDLVRRWEALMGPWGFTEPQLWLAFFEPDGRQSPVLVPIKQLDSPPLGPDDDLVVQLARIVRGVVSDGFVSMAFGRPGGPELGHVDRAWGRALLAARQRHGLPLRVLVLATEGRVRPLVLDDVAA